jgi:hypothetical protein
MPRLFLLLSPLVLCALSACGDTRAMQFAYEPTNQIPLGHIPIGRFPIGGQPAIGLGTVADDRPEANGAVGTVTGDAGFPSQSLVAEQPVARSVGQSINGALMSRGLLAPPGAERYVLSVRLVQLKASQFVRRTATAEIAISLLRRDTGRVVYSDDVRVDGGGWGMTWSADSLAYIDTADTRRLTNHVLNQAIDNLLDKPAFRSAART